MINAAQSGRFRIGGAFEVNRLGFGAMRIVGRGIWGPSAGPRRGAEDAAPPARSRRRLHRHRRFLWPRLFRRADPGGACALRQDPCRDQGRPRAHRTEHLDSARPAGISDPAGAHEPLAARRRDDRFVAVASHRFEGAGQRAVRRDHVADQGQGHPLRRPVGSQRRGDRGGRRRSSRSPRSRTAII